MFNAKLVRYRRVYEPGTCSADINSQQYLFRDSVTRRWKRAIGRQGVGPNQVTFSDLQDLDNQFDPKSLTSLPVEEDLGSAGAANLLLGRFPWSWNLFHVNLNLNLGIQCLNQ